MNFGLLLWVLVLFTGNGLLSGFDDISLLFFVGIDQVLRKSQKYLLLLEPIEYLSF